MKYKKVLFFVILIIIIMVIAFSRDIILKLIYPQTYQEIVSKYHIENNVDEKLIFAVIKAESNFNNQAVSNRGAIGVMQLMEETANEVARKNNIVVNYENIKEELLIVENNICIGTKYLSMLLEKYKSKEVALAAYNAGIGTVDNWIEKGIINSDGSNIENIPYKETNNYVRKTLRAYKMYEELY